jgi:hypothetical protein
LRLRKQGLVVGLLVILSEAAVAPSAAVRAGYSLISATAQNPGPGHYWTATLELTTSHPQSLSRKNSGEAGVADRVIEAQFRYLMFQSPGGLVRLELVSSPPTDSVGIGRDVALYDYQKGVVVAFDKGTLVVGGLVRAPAIIAPGPVGPAIK